MAFTWDTPSERYFQHGLDRGVLYIPTKDPVPWNGLINIDESGGGSSEIIYRDGKIILADVDASDFSATISAFFFPDEFSECLGIPEITENLYIDNQKPKRFGLTYRSLIGSGLAGDRFGYQIHLIYNCLASIGVRNRKTMTNTPEMMEFTFDVVCTPIKIAGFRPTAHYILDTRGMSTDQLADLENVIYGTALVAGHMPTPTELFEMMDFGTMMYVHNEGGGIVSIKGASQYFTQNTDGSWTITNLDAADIGNEYTISDGATTDVIP